MTARIEKIGICENVKLFPEIEETRNSMTAPAMPIVTAMVATSTTNAAARVTNPA